MVVYPGAAASLYAADAEPHDFSQKGDAYRQPAATDARPYRTRQVACGTHVWQWQKARAGAITHGVHRCCWPVRSHVLGFA
jgi:hypothetical protein